MSTPEDRLTAILDRCADRVPVSTDAWSENRRRIAAHRRTGGRRWIVPAVVAAVVVMTATVSALVSDADRTSAAGPAVDVGDRHFGDPALENCVQQIRAGNGDVAQIRGVDPAGTPIVLRLADDGLCTLFSTGGDLIGPGRGVSDEVPYLSVTGGDGWMVGMGAVTSDVDRITFTPAGAALATRTDVPTEKVGSLRAFAMLLPGAGTLQFLDGDTVVGRSDVAPIAVDPTPDGVDPSAVVGEDLLVPAGDRLPVTALSGADVATGTVRAIDAFLGRPLVVTTWGSWCTPCRDQQPELNRAATALDGAGVAMLGLDVLDDAAAAQRYLVDLQVNYPSMTTTPDDVAAAIPGVTGASVPFTAFLDREHRVAQVLVRAVTADEVVAIATALASE